MSLDLKMHIKAKPLQTCEHGFDEREEHCYCLTNAAEALGLLPVATPAVTLWG